MHSQATAFVNDGYLVVPNLVDADELRELEADVVRFARGDYPVSGGSTAPAYASDEQALQSVLAIHFPHWVSPVARRMVEHPPIVEVLARITGAHLPHWDGSVKCMQSMLFAKAPGLPGQAWHQDERFIPTRDRSLLGAWIAIDDATVENGCLWVMPGSHRNGYLWPTRAHDRNDEFDFADESYGFDESDAVAVEVERGSVVFFNGYMLHKSHRNRSTTFRRALVNHYCNAWSLLPWLPGKKNIEGGSVALLDNRSTIVVAGEDPYAWKGSFSTPDQSFLRPFAEPANH